MTTTQEQQIREAQLALEGAIDAILSVEESTRCPQDRYRETINKLRQDFIEWQKK